MPREPAPVRQADRFARGRRSPSIERLDAKPRTFDDGGEAGRRAVGRGRRAIVGATVSGGTRDARTPRRSPSAPLPTEAARGMTRSEAGRHGRPVAPRPMRAAAAAAAPFRSRASGTPAASKTYDRRARPGRAA
ncbi:hypothetical protein [Burkholderia pseudomallei]|uniref:hypothetical protein n=1 Tax=Burkholderia pseudomallei TaxID=28450 RepID=UPI00057224F0|nr:hypothetical protein [Burkholderia pseudomallei]